MIASALEKKIKGELVKLQKEDPEKYEQFWTAFGSQIKYGVVADYGAHKDNLKDLLLFWSSKEGKNTTLEPIRAGWRRSSLLLLRLRRERGQDRQAAPGGAHPGQGV